MKIVLLFTVAMLLAGCASTSPTERKAGSSTTSTTTTNDYSRDMSECEREAVLSGVGSRAQAFDNCMRARNRTPTR